MDKQHINIDENIIKNIIRKEYKGQEIRGIHQYIDGWIHKKFRVSFIGNQKDVVLRFPAEKENVHFGDDYNFDKEVFVSDLISKETSVKVPRILNKGSYDGLEYLLMEDLNGPNLCRASESYDDAILSKIIYEWGSAMSQIHQLKSKNFGYIGSDGITKHFNLWSSMFKDFLEFKLNSNLIPIELRKASKVFYNKHMKELNKEKDSTLVLYDVQCGNVIVNNDGQFLGLLDLELALYGSKSLDFLFLDLEVGNVKIRRPYLKGYTENGGELPQNLDTLTKINTLNFYLSTILNYHDATGKRANVSIEYTKKLEHFLK